MPTIKDVAEKAGVTVTTVSRVLNNRGYISQETRDKVYRVMDELQYRPNEIARSLSRKRSMMLGLIIPTIAHPFFAEMANYIENYAFALGYKILLCNSRLDRVKEKEYINMLKSHRVDGMIMGSHTLDVQEYVKLRQPVITFDRQITDIPYISSDNYQGGVLAAQLLIDRGCRRIAHISGNLSLDVLGNRRLEGFLDTLRKHALEPIVIELGTDVFESSGYDRMIRSLFEKEPEVDGLFASSDIIALHVMKVCSSLGIKVPDRMKLIGYDDISLASLVEPELTTIRQPLEAMSRLAVDLIDKLIRGEKVPLENIVPVTLVERKTC
ncbi:LacI family DNA-binding transcriptional regulator [Paenibacillus dendritiformis]|uniref:Regulatory protein LacI n=1 Tax=Paenibacillus dendritiformis C454 TaxID=1131935 RepID=H3SPM9_9BACL|nr:LacI family DNA-binding transcriptional regulator [Paenibacillus dendritiformis]EHQ58979.1 regulatory protein LacI [Paenibacillus dendritiformis C454]PZM66440.1 LacI family transcriptional regulator [Paenibacillus dendritiformis]CAH8769586.1 LacI family DNA-binding transcriptional regulator [Paenibacillus dendritiformis]